MMSQSKCVVCGRKITYRFYVCRVCGKEYGQTKAEWPEWLRFLVNDTARERMRERSWAEREIFFGFASDIPPELEPVIE